MIARTNIKKTHSLALLAVLGALALVAAGCGSGGGSTSESSNASAKESSGGSSNGYGGRYGSSSENKNASSESEGEPGGAESGAAVVSLGSVQKLGMVLVDSDGMTLYDFHKDKGTTSSCYGPCAEAWPPLLTEGEATVGNGATASKLGTTERKDGTTQVTYAGHPLYTFVEDKKPGEANGNDVSAFGAQWYALKGSGEEAGD
ncbi:MAG: COG4315 family predicted lipoprotein [Solirubrobacterales bacterium]